MVNEEITEHESANGHTERAERHETDYLCLGLPQGGRSALEVRICNISKTGALISCDTQESFPCDHPLLLIPLHDGIVDVEEIERHRGILIGKVVREYRCDGPKSFGISLSPYPMSLFQRIVGWMRDR